MAKLLAILTLCSIACNISGANAQTTNDVFVYVNDQNVEDRRLSKARHEALEIMRSYIRENTDILRQDLIVYRQMIDGLRSTPMTKRTSVPDDFSNCRVAGVAAYIPFKPKFKQVIRICKSGTLLSDETLTQVFIHEAYHLAEGINDFYKDPIDSEVMALKYSLPVIDDHYGCSGFDYAFFYESPFRELLRQSHIKNLKACK